MSAVLLSKEEIFEAIGEYAVRRNLLKPPFKPMLRTSARLVECVLTPLTDEEIAEEHRQRAQKKP